MRHGVIHHISKRKRKAKSGTKKLKSYPSQIPIIKWFDKLILIIAIIIPLATIPQIYSIWIEKAVEGVSIITWGLYFLLSIPMLIYGFIHKDKPIIAMYILWLIVIGLVIIGALIY